MIKLITMITHIVRIEMPGIDAFASIAVICFEVLHAHISVAFAARFESIL
jgi:hypothetical protein